MLVFFCIILGVLETAYCTIEECLERRYLMVVLLYIGKVRDLKAFMALKMANK
jgi:hypothetical protein